jgi:glucose-6-phosphate 1-dehydrogenase
VAPDSNVETFAALRLRVDSWRWEGVPFLIRAGKRLAATATEVRVSFKRPPLLMLADGDTNYVRFRLSPEVVIAIGARVKAPGEALVTEPTELVVTHASRDDLSPYERLLDDAMDGDPMLFAREDSVEAAWTVVEKVLGDVTPVHQYAPGSWGPAAATSLAEDVGGWHDPAE